MNKNSELSNKRITNQLKVCCDGDNTFGEGHPRVYMEIKPEVGEVKCGYCNKIFVYVQNPFS